MFIIYEFLFNRVSVASGGQPNERVSMGLTDRRKTAKNLADSRKN